MGAVLQDLWKRYVWNGEKRSIEYDGLANINGSILQSILSGDNLSGENVTVRGALKVDSVYTCVNVKSLTISSLPGNVFKEEGNNKVVLSDHAVYQLLGHEPNNYMSAAQFWLTLSIHWESWGNGYARINRDSRRNPSSFDILEPWKVTTMVNNGDLWYKYNGETISSWDILHFRFFSLDGICGLSPIMENRNLVGKAIRLDRFSALAIGDQPPGVLSYEGSLNPTQMAMAETNWKKGPSNSVRILPGKWSYQPILSEADAAQYVQTWEATERRIYGVWKLPPTFAQNFQRATFSNAEQSDLVYAKHTTTPICRMVEQEVNMKCFFEKEKKTTYWKFNMNGLLRGDLAARQSFYQAMANTGIMKRNEIRSLEDMNPYEGGDVPLIQGAMIPGDEMGIEAIREKMQKEVVPTAEPDTTQRKNYVNGHQYTN